VEPPKLKREKEVMQVYNISEEEEKVEAGLCWL